MVLACQKRLSPACLIPQRYVLAILVAFASALIYALRFTLAMEEIHRPKARSGNTTCSGTRNEPHKKYASNYGQLSHVWSPGEQGFILGAYFYGYAIGNFPAGFLSEWYGAKHVFGTGILITSVAVIVTPPLLKLSEYNWVVFLLLRTIEGIGSATCFPCITSLLAQWIPPHERHFMVCFMISGSAIGTAAITSSRSYLIQLAQHWSIIYYVFGGCGIVWYFFWLLLVTSGPEGNPYIKRKEKEMIIKSLKPTGLVKTTRRTPWYCILNSCHVWCLMTSQIGRDFGIFSLIGILPTLLNDFYNLSRKEHMIWTSTPHVLTWIIALLFGFICDVLINKKLCQTITIRRISNGLGMMVPVTCLVIVGYIPCQFPATLTLIFIGIGFLGVYRCSVPLTTLELSSNFAATIMGIVNGSGCFTGILVQILQESFVHLGTLDQWRIFFWMIFVIYTVSSIIYITTVTCKEQWWNDIDEVTRRKRLAQSTRQ